MQKETIKDIKKNDDILVNQSIHLMMEGFRDISPCYCSSWDEAYSEVQECLDEERILRGWIDKNNKLIGLIGGIPQYRGNTWELHPLVVHKDYRNKGIGSLLVRDLENEVRRRGGYALYLGTDDEMGLTTLSGIDLYPDLWKHVLSIKNLKNHPYEFYLKNGFQIVGVIPDANGPGKPDILMAKRI